MPTVLLESAGAARIACSACVCMSGVCRRCRNVVLRVRWFSEPHYVVCVGVVLLTGTSTVLVESAESRSLGGSGALAVQQLAGCERESRVAGV